MTCDRSARAGNVDVLETPLFQTVHGGFYKFTEQGMRRVGAGFEFGMELHADEKAVIRDFHRLDEVPVRRGAGKHHAGCDPLCP